MHRHAHALVLRARRRWTRFDSPSMHNTLPSIWVKSYRTQREWSESQELLEPHVVASKELDDALLSSRRPSTHHGWCSACQAIQPMEIDWSFSQILEDGTVLPRWSELTHCRSCRSSSQLRALLELVENHSKQYVQNYRIGLLGSFSSEFMSRIWPRHPNALVRTPVEDERTIRAISGSTRQSPTFSQPEDWKLADGKFDRLVLHQFLERTSNPEKVLSDLSRLLRRNGSLQFVVPFHESMSEVSLRSATTDSSRSLEYLASQVPPPSDFQAQPPGSTFGWGLLDLLRSVGFRSAEAHQYWGPWQGHLGGPSFVFEARK